MDGLDAAERDALITQANLDTAEAVHAGAVLLSHLRSIKDASGAVNHQLNQGGIGDPAN